MPGGITLFVANARRWSTLTRGAVLLAASLTLAAPAAAKAACAHADEIPSPRQLDQARATVRCLINQERKAHGLRVLRTQPNLRKAGEQLARRMVAERFFAHTTPDGQTLVKRVKRARYVTSRVSSFAVAENLGYGTGELSTPREVVASWLQSSAHRRNMLSSRYTQIGIGITPGSPFGDADAMAYVADFGVRRLR